ncbi:ATP-dependent RNA helicase vasa [Orussus abietinus]|uniref:ATP-dependent RNA helicase vasa n=1 Tax=Orussus abietinus TaxID=222816 RepID=UPI000626340D|nr:ATP-dependent RNA helicase vasa [Orussus abietinus]XP_012281401.1 ATP-dependent RNA helicase vasa [Orussus abietinus]
MEDWDDNIGDSAPVRTSSFSEGRSFGGRGRGFTPNNNNEWGVGKHSNSNNNNSSGFGTYEESNNGGDDWESDHRGSQGGRGEGRGFGRGRGGRDDDRDGGRFRNDRDDQDDRDGNDYDRGGRGGRGGRGSRGGDRGDRGGRGGFRGDRGDRNDDHGDDSEDKPEHINKEVYIPPEPSNEDSVIFGNGVNMGINFDKYDSIEVNVSGENPPRPIESFTEAGLKQAVLENVVKSGYKKPTPVQKYALPIIMDRRDLMACAQTGSGKTAAFLVPMINTLLEEKCAASYSACAEPEVVIVSPTRELTIQIYEQARKFSRGFILKCVVTYGGTATGYQAKQVQAGCNILVATPGRLTDFVNRGIISFNKVRFLVLDEADRMLDMGFRQDIEKLIDHETMVPKGQRQTLMFSATFPADVQQLASNFLHNHLFLAVGIVGGACSDVEQTFYEVTKYQKRSKLKELLDKESESGLKRTLVFVETKRNTDFIASFLCGSNFPATSIHGDRLQREREEALADFKRGRMSILVATAVAARGLDIPDVAHVINYDMPKEIDEYVHRIGRTGRVGNRGKATSFYSPDDDGAISDDLVKILRQAGQPVPEFLSGGGGGRSFAPGRSNKFGGRDIRSFNNDDDKGEAYPESAYNAPEAEEEW